jgi:hypothetical protein
MAFINYSAPGGIGGNLIFGTNGGEDMRIDSDGDVGVATTNPTQKLHVAGNILVSGSSSYMLETSGGADTTVLTRSTTDWTSLQSLGDGVVFKSAAGGDLVMIENGGNVGIGASPAYKLDVSGVFRTTSRAIVGNAIDNNAAINAKSTGSHIVSFQKSDNTDIFRITSTGDVGVGTTNPQSLLHVNSTTSNVYIQFPVNSTSLTSADCDAESERGRMIVDGNNVRLHICYGTSGWKTLTPA